MIVWFPARRPKTHAFVAVVGNSCLIATALFNQMPSRAVPLCLRSVARSKEITNG